MIVQLAAICDSAADYGGKLCAMGIFDTIGAKSFPVRHPACSIALRLLFQPEEEGEHALSIRCVGPDGEQNFPALEPRLRVKFPSDFTPFVSQNLVMNLQNLSFPKEGPYRWEVYSNDTLMATIPLRVALVTQGGGAGPAG